MRAHYSIIWLLLASRLPSLLLLRRVLALTTHPTQHTHTDRPRKEVKEDGKELEQGFGVVQVLTEGPHPLLFHELLHGRPISLLPLR